MAMNTMTTDARNNAVNFTFMGTIPAAMNDDAVATNTIYMDTWSQSTDDIAPFFFNGSYIGGNHGACYVQELTVTSHDKTAVDIGSRWLDSTTRQWYLIKIVSPTKLWFISDDSTGTWGFTTSIPASPLTHSWGATHTANITYTGSAVTQAWPSAETIDKSVLVNDSPVTMAGVYNAKTIEVRHQYYIKDATSLLWFLTNNVGSATVKAFNDPAITNIAKVDVTYSFNAGGACTVYQSVEFLKSVRLAFFGGVQQSIMNFGTGKLFEYVPNSVDFSVPVEITAGHASTDMPVAKWLDANNPPNRFIQYVTSSNGTKLCGYALGYNLDLGVTVPATRKTIFNAYNIYTSLKQYPYAINYWPAQTVNSNTVYDVIAFRAPINYAVNPIPLCATWYTVKGTDYALIDLAGAYNGNITFPSELTGKKITIVEQQGTIAVKSSFFTQRGIMVDASGPASLVLKLTNP
jgi:hypothetical protein